MSKEQKKLVLDVKGPGEIKAKDIQPNPDVKIFKRFKVDRISSGFLDLSLIFGNKCGYF